MKHDISCDDGNSGSTGLLSRTIDNQCRVVCMLVLHLFRLLFLRFFST